MEYEYFTSIMTPGIALLILSTTMRLGNVRLALTELAKSATGQLDTMLSYQLFVRRATHLCRGLRLLNITLLLLIPSALLRVIFDQGWVVYLIMSLDVSFFVVLFAAMVCLFLESQLTGKSIVAHTQEVQAMHKRAE